MDYSKQKENDVSSSPTTQLSPKTVKKPKFTFTVKPTTTIFEIYLDLDS